MHPDNARGAGCFYKLGLRPHRILTLANGGLYGATAPRVQNGIEFEPVEAALSNVESASKSTASIPGKGASLPGLTAGPDNFEKQASEADIESEIESEIASEIESDLESMSGDDNSDDGGKLRTAFVSFDFLLSLTFC